MDKLLAKDVAKGRLSSEEAKEARDKVSVVAPEAGIKGMREVDMVIEVYFYISFIKTISKIGLLKPGRFRVFATKAIHICVICS